MYAGNPHTIPCAKSRGQSEDLCGAGLLVIIPFGFGDFSKKFSWDAVKVLEEYNPSKDTSVDY